MLNDNDIINFFNVFKSNRQINWRKIPNEIAEYLNNRFEDDITLKESYARIKFGIKDRPTCPTCGKPLQFTNRLDSPYPKYCSCLCRSNNIEWFKLQQKTKEEHFGDPNYNNRDKYKETCIEKFGVDNPWKSEEVKDNIKQIKIERYNDPYYNNKDKVHETNQRNLGVDMPFQSKEILDKCKLTLKNNIWVENPMYSPDIVQMIRNNCIENTGYDWYAKTPQVIQKVKDTNLERYRATCYWASEEWLEKTKDEEFQKHRREAEYRTKKKNNSFISSKPEKESFKLLKEYFPDVINQYRESRYPFNCDFYIPSLDLFIEFQGSQNHGKKPFDENDENDIKLYNELIDKGNFVCKRDNKKRSIYHAMAYVWRYNDVKKRNIAKQNNLNYLEFWDIDELKKWLENYGRKD